MNLRPFFSYYGGKWRAAPRYPEPGPVIVEPFAGSAGYSVRYPDREVVLVEKYHPIAEVWRYLIEAPAADVRALPDLPDDATVDDLDAPQAARWLIGLIINRGVASPRKRTSSGAIKLRESGRKFCTWGEPMRERIASQLSAIRHWRVIEGDYTAAPDVEATWFVDSPYQVAGKHYPHGSKGIDYAHLGAWCKSRRGRVIVCENEGADWLPFESFGACKAMSGTSAEVVWQGGDRWPDTK